MIAENLLRQVAECGCEVVINNGETGIRDKMNGAIMPKGLISELKRNKGRLLELCVCSECSRVTTNLEDMAVLATNHYLCDKSKCPYKQNARR